MLIVAVCLGVAGFVVIRLALDDSSDSPSESGVAASSTVVQITVTGSPANFTPTIGVLPSATSTAIAIPPDALLQTADQAVEHATQLLKDMGAEHPHFVRIDLMVMGDALSAQQEAIGEDPAEGTAGWSEAELKTTAVWRVQFDGDEYKGLTCRPNTVCKGLPTVIVVLDAKTGGSLSMVFGVPVSQ